MHGSWIDFALAFITAIILLYGLGYVFMRTLTIKGFLAVSIAPLPAVAFISTLAVLYGAIGIKWSILNLVLAVICFMVMIFIIRFICFKLFITTGLLEKIGFEEKTNNSCENAKNSVHVAEYSNFFSHLRCIKNIKWTEINIPLSAAIASGILLFFRVLWNLKIPYAISQSSDGHYHYNNVARMLGSGDLSSLHMLQLPPNTSFYPAAWHDFVVSVIQVTGVSIPVAANAVTYLFLCFVWPISILAFALVISRNKLFLTTVAITSTLIPIFPGIYLWFGILYANIVAAVCMPIVLFVVVNFFFNLKFIKPWQSIVLGIYSLFALGFSQPNTVFIVYYFILILLPFSIVKLFKNKFTEMNARLKILSILLGIILSAFLYLTVTIFTYLNTTLYNYRFTENMIVPVRYGRKEGILAFITGNVDGKEISYFWNLPLMLIVFIGIVFLLVKHLHLYMVFSWILFSFIDFIAASWPEPLFRAYVSGLFYGEPARLLPIQAMCMIIFLSFGLVFIVDKLITFTQKYEFLNFNRICVIFLISIFVLGNISPAYTFNLSKIAYSYSLPDNNFNNPLSFSKNELRFMSRTINNLDKKYTVVGNPWKGATASWFLFGHKNVLYHATYSQDKNTLAVAKQLNQINVNPKICRAVKKLKLKYVYSFAGRCLWDRPCDEAFPGLIKLDENSAFKLIDQDRYGNKLYEITTCE